MKPITRLYLYIVLHYNVVISDKVKGTPSFMFAFAYMACVVYAQ